MEKTLLQTKTQTFLFESDFGNNDGANGHGITVVLEGACLTDADEEQDIDDVLWMLPPMAHLRLMQRSFSRGSRLLIDQVRSKAATTGISSLDYLNRNLRTYDDALNCFASTDARTWSGSMFVPSEDGPTCPLLHDLHRKTKRFLGQIAMEMSSSPASAEVLQSSALSPEWMVGLITSTRWAVEAIASNRFAVELGERRHLVHNCAKDMLLFEQYECAYTGEVLALADFKYLQHLAKMRSEWQIPYILPKES